MTNRWLLFLLFFSRVLFCQGQEARDTVLRNDAFTIRLGDDGRLKSCLKTGDVYPTDYVRPGHGWGAVHGASSFRLDADSMVWTVINEDSAIVLPYNSGGGEDPHAIFEQHVVKHHYFSGSNSFIFWERPTGVGPYLVMTPLGGAVMKDFSTQNGVFEVFLTAARSSSFSFHWAKNYREVRDIIYRSGGIDVQVEPGMTLPNDIEGRFGLRSKRSIDSIVPEFADATSLRFVEKRAGYRIYSVRFNHPGENKLTVYYGGGSRTQLEFFSTEPLETLYKKRAAFITHHQQHRDPSKWYDGLFSIYDMKHQQLRGPDNADYFDTSRLRYVLTCDDPALCKAPFVAAKNLYYPDQQEIDALEYYIEHFVWGKLQRTDREMPNPYGIYGTPSWLVNRDSVLRAANTADKNQDKMHIWRSYDYPHIMMLYYHLYQIASMYPGMTHYLDAKGYLIRAKETAKAYFTYPYAILPWYETYKWGCYNELLLTDLMTDLEKEGYYEDATWLRGEWEKKVKYFLYDDPYPFRSEYAIDATAFESSHALARYAMQHTLRPDSNLWYDKNLHKWYSHPVIRPGDAPAFMRRQTEANIALRGMLEPAYYYLGSDFRGNSDHYTLSYMSQMGGWSILDYALHYAAGRGNSAVGAGAAARRGSAAGGNFVARKASGARADAAVPASSAARGDAADYIRLGYASYLSSFALIDGKTGASGWAFEPQQFTNTWIQKPQGRGPWYYDGEIDLGYGGATRMAATIVTDDPIFGLVAYGGSLSRSGSSISVIPRDGLRRRFYCRIKDRVFDIELGRDGFAAGQPVVFSAGAGRDGLAHGKPVGTDIGKLSLHFKLENRGGGKHETPVLIRSGNGHEQTRMVTVGPGKETVINFDII